MLETFWQNLCSPLALAFALGVFARVIKSELTLPRDVYAAMSIYLLFAIGLKGGVELTHSSLGVFFWPAVATIGIGCLTPITSYVVLRRLGRFTIADSAGIREQAQRVVTGSLVIARLRAAGHLKVAAYAFDPNSRRIRPIDIGL